MEYKTGYAGTNKSENEDLMQQSKMERVNRMHDRISENLFLVD